MKSYEIDQTEIEREARRLRAVAMRAAIVSLIARIRGTSAAPTGQAAH